MNRLIIRLAVFIFVWAVFCSAKTIRVSDDASTIQAGINAAVDGDTVLVADGIYSGEGNINLDFGGTLAVLKSERGPEYTIIDCAANPDSVRRGFYFRSGEDSTAVVEGLTIRGANALQGGGIFCENSSSPTISDCIFDADTAWGGGAISCFYFCSPKIVNCRFINNVARYGGALDCVYRGSPQIIGCRFAGNTGGAGTFWYCAPSLDSCIVYANSSSDSAIYDPGGVLLIHQCQDAVVSRCTFFRNSGYSVSCAYESELSLENCIIAFGIDSAGVYGRPEISCTDIFGNAGGDWTGGIASSRYINGNLCRDPLFRDPAHGDFSIADRSVCAPDNNSCGVLIGADSVGWIRHPRVWHVRAEGTGDTPTIQAAIDSSISGDTVLVADGIYAGPGNRDLTLDGRSIVVKSIRGPEATVIFAGGRPGDFHRGFDIHNNEDSTTVIEGFTIRRGYASIGGGLHCEKSSPKIVSCIFRENGADYGGGISTGCGASPIFMDCDIVDNTATHLGGGMHNFCSGNPRLIECTFRGNCAGMWGGAVCAWGASPTMSGCIVTENRASFGGGVYCGEGSAPDISYCIFSKNSAGVNGGGMTLANEQTADSALIANCTFSNNYAPEIAGGVINIVGTTPVRVENCIVAFSSGGAGISCTREENALSIACTDIYGNSGGDWTGCAAAWRDLHGNFSLDPQFSDTLIDDYSPAPISPGLPDNNDCGVLIGARGICDCSGIGDCNSDGAITPVDIVYLINYILRNGPAPPDNPTCPALTAADFNCDYQTNLVDLVALINYIYRQPALGPCNPCAV